jgi:hypothetical protein
LLRALLSSQTDFLGASEVASQARALITTFDRLANQLNFQFTSTTLSSKLAEVHARMAATDDTELRKSYGRLAVVGFACDMHLTKHFNKPRVT